MFQNETSYNREAYDALNGVFFRVVKKGNMPRRIIFFLIGVANFLFVVWQTIVIPADELGFKMILLVLMLGVSALCIATALFSARIMANLSFRMRNKGIDKVKFTFSDDKLLTQTPVGSAEFAYDTLYGVYETERYFVILVSKVAGEVVSKQGFLKGKATNFPAFLCEKLGLEKIEKLEI